MRKWLKLEWRKAAAERDVSAAAIFEELALGGDRKAHLLESERFLALLAEPELARAA